MSAAFVIAKKEIKGFLFRPNFWIICFLLSALFSYNFLISVSSFAQMAGAMMMHQGMGGQQGNIHYAVFLRHLSMLNLLMIFAVPALTMKLVAEEKKMRTFDLLLTTPIRSLDIVVGKFIAVAVVLLVISFISMLYPISTIIFAKPIQWAPLFIAYLGIFLVTLVYAAMNLFCSSLTESILIAFVMSVILNVSIWFIGMGAEVVDSQWARQIFEHISLNSHLSALVEGTIRSQGLVFLATAIGLFLFLTERVIESHRWRA